MVKVLKDAISKNPDSDADASRVRLPFKKIKTVIKGYHSGIF